jgi:hypothetical protein
LICKLHGVQFGPFVCDHVLRAMGQQLLVEDLVEFEIDGFDDGAVLLRVTACAECAAEIPVKNGDQVSGERVDSEFPYICSTCPTCLAEWRASRSLSRPGTD